MSSPMTVAMASVFVMVAVPSAAYYTMTPASDPLSARLRDYNFFPLKPPSNLMDVGSLYYVSADVSDFRRICAAEKADVEGRVSDSPSWEIEETLNQRANLATNVEIRLVSLFSGKVNGDTVQKSHFTLTGVLLKEIELGSSGLIYSKLMHKPECSDEANRELQAGGYVCQLQEILRATAAYQVDRDSESSLGGHSTPAPSQSDGVVRTAVAEAQSNESLTERQSGVFTGQELTYGVAMNPTCLAPKDSRFPRILPRSRLDRAVNFVLFHIVEPLLPAKRDLEDIAQNAHTELR
jgi:hypothetical protein